MLIYSYDILVEVGTRAGTRGEGEGGYGGTVPLAGARAASCTPLAPPPNENCGKERVGGRGPAPQARDSGDQEFGYILRPLWGKTPQTVRGARKGQ